MSGPCTVDFKNVFHVLKMCSRFGGSGGIL
jgi:hypothetical protein